MRNLPAYKPIDKYIPWMFVLFFLTFTAVDIVMVTLAIRTQTGVVTEHAYEKGLSYNQALDAAAEQHGWGWQSKVTLQNPLLAFNLQDHQGMPIKGAIVKAYIRRPVQSGYDASYVMDETKDHDYQARIVLPLPGEWNVRISAKWQDRHYQAQKTFVVRP